MVRGATCDLESVHGPSVTAMERADKKTRHNRRKRIVLQAELELEEPSLFCLATKLLVLVISKLQVRRQIPDLGEALISFPGIIFLFGKMQYLLLSIFCQPFVNYARAVFWDKTVI